MSDELDGFEAWWRALASHERKNLSVKDAAKLAWSARPEDTSAIPMVLYCPECGEQHIDQPQPEKGWTNPPHRSHECQSCGCVWRPADVPTNGVAALKTEGKRDWVTFSRCEPQEQR